MSTRYFPLFFFSLSLFSLLFACKGKKEAPVVSSPADGQARNLPGPPDIPRTAVWDTLVTAFSAPGEPDRTVSPYKSTHGSGKLEGFEREGRLRLIRSALNGVQGKETYEWLYLDDSGRPSLYREIAVYKRCSPDEPGPCAQESRLYFDASGSWFAALQRKRVLQDASDIVLDDLPFEEYTPEPGIENEILMRSLRYREDLRRQTATKGAPAAPGAAQPDGDRIYYNGDATQLQGKLQGVQPRNYLLRLRQYQTVTIRIQSSAGCVLRISDSAGKLLLDSGTEWEGTPEQAGDLRIAVSCPNAPGASYAISVGEF